MKLVFVIDSWNGGNGGVVALQRLAGELVRKGHEITIVTTGRHEDAAYRFYEVPGYYLPGARESLEKMDFLFAKGVKSVLRKAYAGADLVLVQFPFFVARNAVNVAKKMGIPVAGAAHVQPQNIIAAMGKEDPIMEKLLHALFNFCLYKRVEAIHCPSSFAAHLLYERGSRAHFRVVSNGIPKEYEPKTMTRPQWFGDKFVLLNIGRHAMEKRQKVILKAVAKSKYKENIQLLLCGRGENTTELRQIAEGLPVPPFIDYVSEEEKYLYLNTADMYVHASVVELESLSCLEAIGCGLPCMTGNSPYSAAPQFAMDNRFIFQTDNTDELAEKIDYWYERREELKAMKSSVLDLAEHYRMDTCVAEMEEFFLDVAAGRLKETGLSGSVVEIQNDVHVPRFTNPVPAVVHSK